MEPEPEHEPERQTYALERQTYALEKKLLNDIFKEEQRIKQIEKTIKKVKEDTTKLDKTKRLERAYNALIQSKNKILSIEKRLTTFVSKQRLALASVIKELDVEQNLDYDTLQLIASLIGKGKKSRKRKTKSKKTRKTRTRRRSQSR